MLMRDRLTFALLPKNLVSRSSVPRVRSDLGKGGDGKQQLFSKIS